jgi:hypothetical protein
MIEASTTYISSVPSNPSGGYYIGSGVRVMFVHIVDEV